MAKHDVLNVSYMRKDSQFLADGIWYVTTPCPKCGLVDEEVPWEQAKTPHHAGLIADQRHVKCNQEAAVKDMLAFAQLEIAAAEEQLAQQVTNLEQARALVHALECSEAGPAQARSLAAAREQLRRHTDGLDHARRRASEIRKHNSPK